MDRRTFIRQVARGGILASMVAAAGLLIARDQITFAEDCSENFRCRNCSKLKGCSLPEAISTRESDGKG